MEVQEVKNIVGTARDLLVGKVPLPVDQCQEITRALIYKFLSAADSDSVGLGGESAYFTGDGAECRWDVLMSAEQTANDVDRRYRKGMALLGQTDGMPAIQTIYQDAYIPYNDPIILRDFLRTIDRFDTGDTEKIGDAYEMLLQDLGAQASAGQFRTPRHIIDFIVDIVDPQKHETILDPACGTGGFLVSAWEHINRAGRLSAADRGNLARNLTGCDISPTMEMLATVNLFLHHKQQPVVSVYDTLTSKERWNDHYDVILANPPFMSPKGGIRPHDGFSVSSRRSEVLFVDYIAEHLTPAGRAGVIVPEGVIFQSQRAHTQLRKMLVEGYLAAVISLPAGVFQPYSGVKTSILILDRALAGRAEGIAFFKAANDGYDLGAQRRPIEANDLPTVRAELSEYLRRLRAGESVADFAPTTGLVVAKERIAEGGDWNLSGERYRENGVRVTSWPMVALGDVARLESGSRQKGGAVNSGIPSIGGEQIGSDGSILCDKMKFVSEEHFLSMKKGVLQNGDVLLVKDGATTGKTGYFGYEMQAAVNEHVFIVRATDAILPYYLYSVVRSDAFQEILRPYIKGIIGGISREISAIEIPLPPLEVQRGLVEEVEGYQRAIDAAKDEIVRLEQMAGDAVGRVWEVHMVEPIRKDV